MTELIERPVYTKRIEPFIGKNIIKVLTGQRRVGKSCILQQIQNHIRQSDANANIIAINKERDEFAFLRTNKDLSSYVAGTSTNIHHNAHINHKKYPASGLYKSLA